MSDNPIFSYSRRDYEGSRKEGIAQIPILSNGNWVDLNATDPGIIILDYVHALVDMINYYQDHQALESFITTAKERANIFRLAKQLSYNIRSAKGATCRVTFTSTVVHDHAIKIPKYTTVSTSSGISYLTTEDAYLPTGEDRINILCTQGTLSEIKYKGTGISRFSNVVGAANQSVNISSTNIDIDSITVTDSIGRLWTPVDYIVFSKSTDRAYQVDLNPDNTVTVKFGDGERGVVPKETEEFTIQYILTKAEEGQVSANTLLELMTPIYDNSFYIDFSVCNLQASVGGSSVQSSEEIRELAPGAIKAQNRAVTLSDFENLAKLVSGVADAKAYDINTNPDLCLYHEVKVLIVPDNNNTDSIDSLKDSVYSYLSKRMIPPTNLQVFSPTYQSIDISIVVKRALSSVEGSLEYDIYDEVSKYFKNRAGGIGESFYPADLSSYILNNVENVKTIVSITPSSPVELSEFSIASLGELNIEVL